MKPATVRQKIVSISKSAAILILASAWMASAQSSVSVTSSTDGNGLFSYTFNLGTSPYVWGISPDNGDIVMQSHGILDIISPPGWAATVDANELITWQPTSGTVYVGESPLTFSVLSSYTDSTVYDQWGVEDPTYLAGLIGGSLYTISDHQGVALGYETFSFVGPQVPEPSALALGVLALLLVKPIRRFLAPASEP